MEDTRGDIVLIERIVARDEQAVADLYDRHCRLLFGLIVRVIRDRREAEEILQEVFVVVWPRADTYNLSLGRPAARGSRYPGARARPSEGSRYARAKIARSAPSTSL